MSKRPYAKVFPEIWIGPIGKKLRSAGADTQLIALYVITSPHANMLGLYYLPRPTIKHETGLSDEAVSAGLAKCVEIGFCTYDDESEFIWVYEMATWQIADRLKATDNQSIGVQSLLHSLPENPYSAPFYDKYSGPFSLTRHHATEAHEDPEQAPSKPLPGPLQGPSKPLRSQKQEQEKENYNKSSRQQEQAASDTIIVGMQSAFKNAGVELEAGDSTIAVLVQRCIPLSIVERALQRARRTKGNERLTAKYVLSIIDRLEKEDTVRPTNGALHINDHGIDNANCDTAGRANTITSTTHAKEFIEFANGLLKAKTTA